MANGSRFKNDGKEEPKAAQTDNGSEGEDRELKRRVPLEQREDTGPFQIGLLLLLCLLVNPAHDIPGKIRRDIQWKRALFRPGAIFLIVVHTLVRSRYSSWLPGAVRGRG